MFYVMNLIEFMQKQVVEYGITEEIKLTFPSKEEMEKTWQEQHPAEICNILKDYVKFFVNSNSRFFEQKQEQLGNLDSRNEKQIIFHNLEIEKLQFCKKENGYQFLIERLSQRKDELENKIQFMEQNCNETINYLSQDNQQLVKFIKEKDNVLNKIQEQIEIKNENIHSQDQKLLSVFIYEFKLRKIDIQYQSFLDFKINEIACYRS